MQHDFCTALKIKKTNVAAFADFRAILRLSKQLI